MNTSTSDQRHFTNLTFFNYPGEGATGFDNDPRTKQRINWYNFLKHIYTQYTGRQYTAPARYDSIEITERLDK